MRNTTVATLVVVCLSSGVIGCKTASKMAWWKTADKGSVEATAMAHTAPALPADVAKQAEALAASSPKIEMSEGQADPFKPTPTAVSSPAPSYAATAPTMPSSYPTTGASPYSTTSAPTNASSVAASNSTMMQSVDSSADLGEVAMPYNPNAVPPAKTIASVAPAATPDASVDRYGNTLDNSMPAYGSSSVPPIANATITPPTGNDRYANVQPNYGVTTPVGSNAESNSYADSRLAATETANTPSAYGGPPSFSSPDSNAPTPSVNVAGDRYASSSANAGSNSPGVASDPASRAAMNSAQVATSAPIYRPGGTSSYNAPLDNSPAAEIATRPDPPRQEVPNVATPSYR